MHTILQCAILSAYISDVLNDLGAQDISLAWMVAETAHVLAWQPS